MAAQEENYSLPAGFGTRPWLIQATRSKTLTLVDPVDQSLHETVIPEIDGKTCLGCLHDGSGDCWLVMLDERTCECFLLSLAVRRKIPLPPLREPLKFLSMCAAIESPGHPDFTVLVSSTAEAGDRFLHSRPGDPEWTKMTSPFGANGITFSSNMISYKGKVYSFTSSRALVMILIDLDDGVVRVRQVGKIQYEEEVAGFGYYVHLVESRGDLFAVWIQELEMYGNDGVLTDIVVYRLDRSAGSKSMEWRTVESIGDDRAFLVSGGYGFSCAARGGQMELEGNCVYLVWSCCDCERLYKFCLDDMTISFRQVLPILSLRILGPEHFGQFRRATYTELLSTIKHYDGTNFTCWHKHVQRILKILDLDYALREDKSSAPTVGTENYDDKLREYNSNSDKWERSNDLAKMVISQTINDALRGSFPTTINGKELSVKDFMYSIEKHYKDKLASILIKKLMTSRYNGQGAIRAHINSMGDIADMLEAIGIHTPSTMLLLLIIASLPENYVLVICNFCEESGHMLSWCPRFIAWLQNRGTPGP